MMNKHSILVLSLLTAMGATACSDSSDGGGTGGAAGSGGRAGAGTAGASGMHTGGSSGSGGSGHAGTGGTPGTAGSGGNAAGGTAGNSGGTAGSGGNAAGGTAGNSGGTGGGGTTGDIGGGGSGGACDIPSIAVFPRSDTDATWDDNDFSDVTFTGSCPTVVGVTWPHEAGYQNADPAESNHESTHFTIDSYSSVDLTNKALSLTIALSTDHRGTNATAGSYVVSLVSVSTYDIVTGGGGSGGETSTTTGYSEAETPVSDRATLSHEGDHATLTFALPNKTDVVSSYDPTRVIKINVRIYSTFASDTGGGGAGGTGGVGGTAGVGGVSGTAGTVAGGTAGIGGTAAGTGGTGSTTPAVYEYLTSEFSITNFSIKDVGVQ